MTSGDRVRAPAAHGHLRPGAERPGWSGAARWEPAPILDEDGLLRHRGRWVAIPDAQVEVVRLLVENLGRVVSLHVIRSAYVGAGGSGHPNAIRTLVARLRHRVRTVGLHLEAVRRRGIVLTVAPLGER